MLMRLHKIKPSRWRVQSKAARSWLLNHQEHLIKWHSRATKAVLTRAAVLTAGLSHCHKGVLTLVAHLTSPSSSLCQPSHGCTVLRHAQNKAEMESCHKSMPMNACSKTPNLHATWCVFFGKM